MHQLFAGLSVAAHTHTALAACLHSISYCDMATWTFQNCWTSRSLAAGEPFLGEPSEAATRDVSPRNCASNRKILGCWSHELA